MVTLRAALNVVMTLAGGLAAGALGVTAGRFYW